MYSIYVCMCINNCIVYHKLTTSAKSNPVVFLFTPAEGMFILYKSNLKAKRNSLEPCNIDIGPFHGHLDVDYYEGNPTNCIPQRTLMFPALYHARKRLAVDAPSFLLLSSEAGIKRIEPLGSTKSQQARLF